MITEQDNLCYCILTLQYVKRHYVAGYLLVYYNLLNLWCAIKRIYCIYSPKAVKFYGMTVEDVCDWFSSIGLSMYSDLISDKHITGEKLAEMVTEPTNQHLVVRTDTRTGPTLWY